ncbi:hypothetical protein B0O80DRAFT_266692 [Mortierella sp. GBAus27b]|nr:hypothetical protein B0O80DRAFT_266692 [Mortierella sp. GBAus27b]
MIMRGRTTFLFLSHCWHSPTFSVPFRTLLQYSCAPHTIGADNTSVVLECSFIVQLFERTQNRRWMVAGFNSHGVSSRKQKENDSNAMQSGTTI